MKSIVASFIALIMCSNLALTNPQNDDQLHAATSRFAFKLYDQVAKQRAGENTFVSPASVMLALAMTYNGSDGTTRQAMARTLELEGMSLDEVNRAFAELKSALKPTDPKISSRSRTHSGPETGSRSSPTSSNATKTHSTLKSRVSILVILPQ